MATTSYPAVGNNGFNEEQWEAMYGAEDGIICDYVGTACSLSRINDGDFARISAGKIRINGYVLDITGSEDLYCAPVPAGQPNVVYHIAGMYDPDLNVPIAGTDPPQADPDGPCRLIVSPGPPDTSGGQQYVLLDKIDRAPSQLIANSAVTSYRRWTAPNIEVDVMPAGELASPRVAQLGFGPFARGTIAYERTTRNVYYLTLNDAGTGLEWRSVTNPAELAFPNNSPLVAVDAPPRMRKVASEVMLRGTLKRANGQNLSTGSEVVLGTFPAGWRPANIERFICYGNGVGSAQVVAPVKVTTDGVVTMYNPPDPVVWIALSGIQFRAER